ncbi:hypothetical protein M409DRAFT_23963 [Zasmidium cellare ATCC 36951]|uniref:Uncharacterized protein n=1 Tax=Zasmidium cellare ATCC 36951 TaxID=1080233 RepID=A0A6A6CGA3_ZASCE|nr:uncharacterized protein M409DRAFT_23963 [Zasmidium cellare ATCC 36951]KAF2165673.1 hypothetical protein M409DRAFT_23963 [Zasmidium cellare ATCC 36951]
MQLVQFWSLTLLLVSPASAAAAVQYCGAVGVSTKLPYFTSAFSTLRSSAACGKHRAADTKCQSYAIGTGLCLHYASPVASLFKASSISPWKLYDRICAPVVPSFPSNTGSASTPTAGTDGHTSIDVGGSVTSPVIATTDSPDLPSSSVVFPTDDKSFTVTYTYYEEPLPSIISMGSPPIDGLPAPTSGLPNLPCIVDPSSTNSQFNLLGSNFVPLVSTSGKLQPLPTPTSEAQAKAMGPPDSVALPYFFFQKPASGTGAYDIVLAGSTAQYIAKTSIGGMILTSASTGTTAKTVNGQSIITSIFNVDCKGRISVQQGTTLYTWDVNSDGTAATFVTGAPTNNRTMVTYSMQMKAKAARNRRRSIWTEGAAPRCPNSPANLHAAVFPGARGLAPNGCGAAKGFDFVPDFSFGKCCDGHDNCYDDCNRGTWEGCNNQFHDCMRGSGCDYLNNWYSYIPYLACLKAADFYYWSVTGSIGRGAFYSANTERCKCYCPDSQALCGTQPNGPYTCTNLFSTDVNNCGACGRTCSAKSTCTKGSCTCPIDQCGDRCVNLKDNPNHCGSCSTKCPSGQDCYQGQCYLPPPNKCASVDGFSISPPVEQWSTCPQGCSADGFTQPLSPYYTGSPTLGWKIAKNGYATIGTTVKMCPGTDYLLSFNTNHCDGIGIHCNVKWKFGQRDWSALQGFPTPDDCHDHASPQYEVPGFNVGDAGTTGDGLALDVPFAVYLSCDGETFSVKISGFELVAQGSG